MFTVDSLALVAVGACALFFSVAILLTRPWHSHLTADFENSGVQKHHTGSPPRVGGLAVMAGVAAGWAWLDQSGLPAAAEAAGLLALIGLCSLPAVFAGLLEDLTKRIKPRWRLLASGAGAVLGMLMLGAVVPGVGLAWLDPVVQWWPVGAAMTLLLVSGFTQAMNIIDGLNGLAAGLTILMMGATAYVANTVGDPALVHLCLVLAAAVAGFLVLNFPRGLLFLGDGGAYFLGFVMALIWVLLLVRNPGEVSPWFCIAVSFHPTMETIYSIVRRKVRASGASHPMAPDTLHMHTLVYKRRCRHLLFAFPWLEKWVANSAATVVVLILALPSILASVFAAHSTGWLLLLLLASVGLYLLAFMRLLRFGRLQRPALKATHAHRLEKLKGAS